MFLLIIERQQTIARIVAFPAIGAGNKTADVHSAVIVIRRNRKACPATARDQEHPQTANRIVLHCASLHRNQLHFNQQPKWLVRNARVVTGLCPVQPAGRVYPSTVASVPFFFRWFDCKNFFLNRNAFGVTSTNSSSATNSIACSRLRLRKGTSRIAMSDVEARMLVSFFSRTMLTSRSVSLAFSPMIMPS